MTIKYFLLERLRFISIMMLNVWRRIYAGMLATRLCKSVQVIELYWEAKLNKVLHLCKLPWVYLTWARVVAKITWLEVNDKYAESDISVIRFVHIMFISGYFLNFKCQIMNCNCFYIFCSNVIVCHTFLLYD